MTLALLLLAPAAICAAEPPPPVSAAERAAAFPLMDEDIMHEHMHMDPVMGMFKAEELEVRQQPGADGLHWDVSAWLGNDRQRLWLRDEGEREAGEQAENRLELLWTVPLDAWWDGQAGVRLDTSAGPSRTYGALGLQGLAPQWVHLEVTGYVGEGGQLGARLQADYDWLFTNRLVLAGRLETDAWAEDDPEVGIGSGWSEITLGLRLRYEIRREFAPYLGVEWYGLLGDTADYARAAGEDRRDARLVAGLRFWF